MSKRLLTYWSECRATGVLPSAEALRQVIEPEVAPETAPPPPPLLTDLLAFKERRARVLRPNTIKAYKTLHNTLKRYEDVTGWPLRYADLTLNFWHEFTAYLLSLPVKGKIGWEDNSIAKLLAHLKTFLKDAQKTGLNPLQDFSEWHWARRDGDVLALTRAELTALEQVNLTMLPDAARLENARSLFLISCYTGLRFSDVAALKPQTQQGEWLHLTVEKTATRLTVPLRGALSGNGEYSTLRAKKGP